MTKEPSAALCPVAFGGCNVAVMRSVSTLILRKGIRRLGHQQELAHALWTTICLGYGLLFHLVHTFVQWKQSSYFMAANAPYVLGCQHRASE
jgi:hypothetical protein